MAGQEAGNTYQPIRRPETPVCSTFSSWRGQSSHLKRAAQRRATQSARATSGVFHANTCTAPSRLAARTGAQVDFSAAAFPGTFPGENMPRFPQFLLCLAGETPCERRLLCIRAANGARHVVIMSWETYFASSRGYDARGAYVAAAAHSDATGPAVLENGRQALLRFRGAVGMLCFLPLPCISQDSQK